MSYVGLGVVEERRRPRLGLPRRLVLQGSDEVDVVDYATTLDEARLRRVGQRLGQGREAARKHARQELDLARDQGYRSVVSGVRAIALFVEQRN